MNKALGPASCSLENIDSDRSVLPPFRIPVIGPENKAKTTQFCLLCREERADYQCALGR